MNSSKLLHNYDWNEYPELVAELLSGRVKLFALVVAKGETFDDLFFLTGEPGSEDFTDAKGGVYEICENELVIEYLEYIYRGESDPLAYREGGGPHTINLKWFKSLDGQRGLFSDMPFGDYESYEKDGDGRLPIPFTRILVEPQLIETGRQVPKFDPIKTLMMRYLDQTEGRGDLRGCVEFLLADPEIEDGGEGKIVWTSYSGKPQEATRKTIQNRFAACRKEWKPNR